MKISTKYNSDDKKMLQSELERAVVDLEKVLKMIDNKKIPSLKLQLGIEDT